MRSSRIAEMFHFRINRVPVLFIQAFTAQDAQTILWFVRESADHSGSNVVLFIDTPVAPHTVPAVQMLLDEGYRVIFRDHHGLETKPANDNQVRVGLDIAKLERLLGPDCLITLRSLHPACSTLVEVGEFKGAAAIIADPDADGLTAAMKAAGISYDALDSDAAILDGEPYLQTTGSPLSQLLAKGVATLPSFDYRKPREREDAKHRLFSQWVDAVLGNERALNELEKATVEYDQAVRTAAMLSRQAVSVAPGVMLVNVVDMPLFDPGTLINLVEKTPGCKITVLRKGLGPIAAVHGVQYSLAVAKPYQDQINFQLMLPEGLKSDPKTGVISNLSFLLHVSESVWNDHILPRLKEL